MLIREYYLSWLAAVIMAVIVLLGGHSALTAETVLGFFSIGLIFVGMMCILPYTISHRELR
jgi:amino acid permease